MTTATGPYAASRLPRGGCAGAPARVACGVTRASFSVAGCTVINKPAEAPKKRDGKKSKRGG